jgi:hypothetical protein
VRRDQRLQLNDPGRVIPDDTDVLTLAVDRFRCSRCRRPSEEGSVTKAKAKRVQRRSARDRRTLDDVLFDGEEVRIVARPGRLATFPKYAMTLGAYGLWRKRNTSAVTDQRILLGKGLIRRDETSIPLGDVDDVSIARRGLYSYADITTERKGRTNYTRVGPLTPRAARRFAREVLQHH